MYDEDYIEDYEQDDMDTDFDVNLGLDSNGIPILPTVTPHIERKPESEDSTISFSDAMNYSVEDVKQEIPEDTSIQKVENPIVAILNKANKEVTSVTISTDIEIAPVSLLSTLRDTLDPVECEEAFISIIKENIERNMDVISKNILSIILRKTQRGTQRKPKPQIDTQTPQTKEDDNTTSSLVED